MLRNDARQPRDLSLLKWFDPAVENFVLFEKRAGQASF